MNWTIIASISAAISAGFAALSAFLMWWKSRCHYKIKIHKSNQDNPHNIFTEHYAMVHVQLQNTSAHAVFISDCSLNIGKIKYSAFQSASTISILPAIDLITKYRVPKNAKLRCGYLNLPLQLEPYEYLDCFLLFDGEFTNKESIKAKLIFHSLTCYIMPKSITLYNDVRRY